jgi:soluble epoxide hydrolase / lipid-phosphate phosphatase
MSRRTWMHGVAGGVAATALGDALAHGAAIDDALPAPQFVQTNGIKMAVYEQGRGVPVILCHGFPELAYSWRHQLAPLAAVGYQAIAVDQRGYGLTDRPD